MPAVASLARSTKRCVADQGPGARVLQDVAHLRCRQPPVDRHGDGPEAIGGEDRLEEFRAVVREQAHRRRPGRTPRSCRPAGQCRRRGPPSPRRWSRRPSNTVIGLSGRARRVVGQHREPVHVRLMLVLTAPSPTRRSSSDPSVRIPLASPPCARRRTRSRRSPKWEGRREAIIDTSARVFARRGYHATGIMELCAANDLGQGSPLPLHRLQGGAARRHPRPGDGRGDARRRPGGRRGRDAVAAAGHAGRRAARRDPPLPRPRLGLPARVPRPDRRSGRAVPGPAPGVRAPGRGRAACGRRVGRVPRHRPVADGAGLARHAQLHVSVAEAGWPSVGPRRGAARSPRSSCGASPAPMSTAGRGRVTAPSSRRRRPAPAPVVQRESSPAR